MGFSSQAGVAAEERTAVLIVRAWIGDSLGEGALRARITRTLDVSSEEKVETAAASREEILHTVQEWLDEFAGRR
jgi:hypothetical protein